MPSTMFHLETALVVQWLRLCAPNAGDLGSISGHGIRSHMPQLRVYMLQLKILGATTKTWHSQIDIYIFLKTILINVLVKQSFWWL